MRAIDYFDKAADVNPESIAIIDGENHYSYRETREITIRIARAMWANGLCGEQCAGIYSHNDARVLFCMLGIMRAGAVWVPINYRNATDANVEYMNYVEMAWLFYHSNFRDSVAEIKARVPSLRHLVCLDTEDGSNPSLETFMARGQDAEEIGWADPTGNPDRLVGLVPTGGTTGPAKGVKVTSLGHDDGNGHTLLARRHRRSGLLEYRSALPCCGHCGLHHVCARGRQCHHAQVRRPGSST
jgi:acyl-CoA synthetase (AMP-forming)/AMP-acid ligase II